MQRCRWGAARCVCVPTLPPVRPPGSGRGRAGERGCSGSLSLTFHGCVRPLRSACPLDGPACRRTRRCAWRRAHLRNARHSATRLNHGVTAPQPTARHRMRARPCAESRSGKNHVKHPACSPTMRHTKRLHPSQRHNLALPPPTPACSPQSPRSQSAGQGGRKADLLPRLSAPPAFRRKRPSR